MTLAATETPLSSSIQQFLGTERAMLVDGKFIPALSGRTSPTLNPATGEPLSQIPDGQKEDIDIAVKAARNAFEKGRSLLRNGESSFGN